jgi:hypothetical protein
MPSHFDITRGEIDSTLWDSSLAGHPLPLQQHWAYGRALQAIGVPVELWLAWQEHTLQAFALVAKRRFFGLVEVASMMRGPVWMRAPEDGDNIALMTAFKAQARPWRWRFLAQQPELAESSETLSATRKAGLTRVMTGYSTVWLDLAPEVAILRAGLDGKWRNQLNRAEDAHLSISLGGRKPQQYAWLIEKEAEQRKGRGYHGVPLGLVPLYADAMEEETQSQAVLSVSALSGRRKIAGAMFLMHGNSATYHIGWASEEARAVHAQNRVIYEGMLALKERGIRFLDLGGIDTASGAGIARFKLGTGARASTLAGTFI